MNEAPYQIIKYVVTYVAVPIGAIWTLYKIRFEKNLEGNIKERVEKEINKHYLTLGHSYARQMADYVKFVEKKHSVYSEMSAKMTLIQGLLSNEESVLNNIGMDKIRKYQQEKNSEALKNAFTNWSKIPDNHGKEKEKAWKVVERLMGILKTLVLNELIPEAQQYFYLNKIYFSEQNKLCSKIAFLIREIESFKKIKFEWTHEMRLQNSVELDKLMSNIDKWMEEIICIMREELSAN